MIIEIEGMPIAKARHRHYLRHGCIIAYDPQEDAKNATRFLIQRKFRQALDSDDRKIVVEASNLTRSSEFDVEIDFYLPIAKSSSEPERNRFLWIGRPNVKPDVDNLAKFYLDCANGILWTDDKQIVSLKSKKYYSDKPRTVIKIIGRRSMHINDKALGILGVFSPEEFYDFCHDIDKIHENMVKIIKMGQEAYRMGDDSAGVEVATRSAVLLSMISDKYADKFKKIKTKCPNFHEEWQKSQDECKTVLHDKESNETDPS